MQGSLELQLIPVISRKINLGVTIRAWNWSEESAQGTEECLQMELGCQARILHLLTKDKQGEPKESDVSGAP